MILELSRGHGDTGLPRVRGRAHHLRGALPHRGDHRRASCAPASASSPATVSPSPCATCPSGPWRSGGRPWRAASWCRSTPGGRAPSCTTGWPTRAPPWPSSTRRASTACMPHLAELPDLRAVVVTHEDRTTVPGAARRARAHRVLRRAGRHPGGDGDAARRDHRARRRRHDLLHVGHDGEAQGCGRYAPEHGHKPHEPVLPQHPGRSPLARARRGPRESRGRATRARTSCRCRSSTPRDVTRSWWRTPRRATSSS